MEFVENPLLKQHLQPLKVGTAARRMGIHRGYLAEIIKGYPMSARIGLLLEQNFPGRSAEFWISMGPKPEKRLEQLAELRKSAEISGTAPVHPGEKPPVKIRGVSEPKP